MTLREIIEKFASLRVDEQRCNSDQYHELVFYREQIDEWHRIAVNVFGPAEKAAGEKPTKDHLHLTRDYGGIWAGQTLFKKRFKDATVLAMFWPWEDGIHATLKIALLEKETPEVALSAPLTRFGFTRIRARLGKWLF